MVEGHNRQDVKDRLLSPNNDAFDEAERNLDLQRKKQNANKKTRV